MQTWWTYSSPPYSVLLRNIKHLHTKSHIATLIYYLKSTLSCRISSIHVSNNILKHCKSLFPIIWLAKSKVSPLEMSLLSNLLKIEDRREKGHNKYVQMYIRYTSVALNLNTALVKKRNMNNILGDIFGIDICIK